MNNKIISLIAVFVLFSGLSLAALGNTSDGADPIIVTDGEGNKFEYTEPTEHIVTMGYASTLTVAMLGGIDKIIAVDKYSTYDYTKDERLKDLDAKDMGSIYSSSNNDYIVSGFVQWVDKGLMNLNDTIILTAYSNAKVLRDLLNSVGFNKVLVYLTITNYDQIIDFVEDMSYIVTGKSSKLVEDMKLVKTTITDGLKNVTRKADGLGIWYSSSGEFTVGNTGSITVSLIEAAGGANVAYNSSVSSSTYGSASTIVQLVEKHEDVVIFLPHSYVKDHTVEEFRKNILGGDQTITVVPMEQNWNNYCPDAAEGLWKFACAMYPEIFSGEIPKTKETLNLDFDSENGSISWKYNGTYGTGKVVVKNGDAITLTPKAAKEYEFFHWKLDGIVKTTSEEWTFTPKNDSVVTAVFVNEDGSDVWTVSITSEDGTVSWMYGDLSGTGDVQVKKGDSIILVPNLDDEHEFVHWELDGTVESTTEEWVLSPKGDCAVTEVFAEKSDSDSDMLTYAIIGVVAIIAIVGIAYFVMRRP